MKPLAVTMGIVLFAAFSACVLAEEPAAAPAPAENAPAVAAPPVPAAPAEVPPPPPPAPQPPEGMGRRQILERLRNMTPEEQERWLQELPAEQRERVERVRRASQAYIRESFIMRFLRENADYVALQEKHRKTLEDIGQQLKQLADAAKPKLTDPKLPEAERAQLTADTKDKARALLKLFLEEQINYQKAINDLITVHSEEILDKATEAVFAGKGPEELPPPPPAPTPPPAPPAPPEKQ